MLVYDPITARAAKEEVDMRRALLIESNRNKSRIMGALLFGGSVAVMGAAIGIVFVSDCFLWVIMFIVGMVTLLAAPGSVPIPQKIPYSLEAKYYVATKDKAVLKAWVEWDGGSVHGRLWVAFENKAGLVEKAFIATLPVMESTEVEEVVVDLKNEVVLVPYGKMENASVVEIVE